MLYAFFFVLGLAASVARFCESRREWPLGKMLSVAAVAAFTGVTVISLSYGARAMNDPCVCAGIAMLFGLVPATLAKGFLENMLKIKGGK